MKKGIEWLHTMSRKEQVMFLKHLVTYPPSRPMKMEVSIFEYLNEDFASFYIFITNSFNWAATPEGHQWWSEYASSKKI